MTIHLAMLPSDWLLYALFIGIAIIFFHFRHSPAFTDPWRHVLNNRLGMIALVILFFYIVIGLLDSIHLQISQVDAKTGHYNSRVASVLDLMLSPLGQQDELTYSAPFAIHLYNEQTLIQSNGQEIRTFPRLKYGGAHLKNENDRAHDITVQIIQSAISALIILSILLVLFKPILARSTIAWREALCTFSLLWMIIWILSGLATHYHVLGTDKVGGDLLYQSIKSIRTGLVIGTLTTLFTLPFALILGALAGYFRGWIDDIIQYSYITLSSIPGILLITASVLVLQVYIANHPNLFPTLLQRADARLVALCFILGITSWASLCRLLRAETLKLREQEYVLASVALGVKHFHIIMRHILPNVMHIVLITVVIDFSGLVLAEAVLAYIGVGVDPTTISWGNMINSSRLELARDPIVWWPLLSAFIFMLFLVLAANIFSDAVRDAFDPRLRLFTESEKFR